jgi:secondary thiamine-phosphate synthase enzyme
MFVSKEIHVTTKKPLEIINITDEVKKFLVEHHCKDGLVNVFTRHTTATIKIKEFEDGFAKDLQIRCDKHVPADCFYHHNDLPNRDPKTMYTDKAESLDGHSHIRYLLLGATSETIPVKEGKMLL